MVFLHCILIILCAEPSENEKVKKFNVDKEDTAWPKALLVPPLYTVGQVRTIESSEDHPR